jgi:ABC-type branched-subunit amino acid transport system ATPase component
MAIADYVHVLRKGTIVAQGTADALPPGDQWQRAYLGRARENGKR